MKMLLALLFVVSCATQPISKVEDAAPVVIETIKPTPVVTPNPEPAEYIVKVDVKSLKGFTPAQEIRFKKIAANVQILINSKEFKEGVLNFTYLNKKAFTQTKDSNELVLQNILKKDWVLEYKLEKIPKKPFSALTVGYTYPNVTWIVINSLIFNSYDDASIACNIIHEFGGHKLGRYDHDMKWSKARDYSVPYGIGYMGEKMYKEMFKDK